MAAGGHTANDGFGRPRLSWQVMQAMSEMLGVGKATARPLASTSSGLDNDLAHRHAHVFRRSRAERLACPCESTATMPQDQPADDTLLIVSPQSLLPHFAIIAVSQVSKLTTCFKSGKKINSNFGLGVTRGSSMAMCAGAGVVGRPDPPMRQQHHKTPDQRQLQYRFLRRRRSLRLSAPGRSR